MQTSLRAGRLQRRIQLDDLPEIELRRSKGESLASIAKSYGCTKQAVRHMIKAHGLDETKARKRDDPILMTYKSITLPLNEWAKRTGINRDTLRFRYVRKGWSAERSLTEPVARGPLSKRKKFSP